MGHPLENSPLEDLVEEEVEGLGYRLVAIVKDLKGRRLQIFIEHQDLDDPVSPISIEDCVKVTKALNEPLDQSEIVDRLFPQSYSLEVSSPGLERPLRKAEDFERFKGRKAKVQVFRPLTGEELENEEFQTRYPKQKRFIGKLLGLGGEKVRLTISDNGEAKIGIPISLISKANLHAEFEDEKKHSE